MASGEIQIKDQLTNTTSTLKATALTGLLFQGEVQFFQLDVPANNQVTRIELSADFTQMPTELREEAKRRAGAKKEREGIEEETGIGRKTRCNN